MTMTACQSIPRLPETFHGQCVAVILVAEIFIWQCMVFVLRKHWQWLNNGEQMMQALSWQEIRSLSKAGSRSGWQLFAVVGLDYIQYSITEIMAQGNKLIYYNK